MTNTGREGGPEPMTLAECIEEWLDGAYERAMGARAEVGG